MNSIPRILDANANRSREALRVMEEAARFILNDGELSGDLKQLRHDLAAVLSRFSHLETARDTLGDVGTTIKTTSETQRSSVADVVIAAGKRLSEALRSLEEYGKVIDGDFATKVESLRYRAYELERRLHAAMGSGKARQWRLCVLISEALCPGEDWRTVAKAAIAGGADCLQLREKQCDDAELLRRAKELVAMAGKTQESRKAGKQEMRNDDVSYFSALLAFRPSVIINDRPDIALLAEADGVHLGQSDLPCTEVRKLVGRQLIIGVSTSRVEEAQQAMRDGADYCGIGPMFPTTTKHKDVIVGPSYARAFVEALPGVPHLAIGGITVDNIGDVLAAGARGVAVSSCVCGADDPQAVVESLVKKIK